MSTLDYPVEAALLNSVLRPHFPDDVAIVPHSKDGIQIIILLDHEADVDACERLISRQRKTLMPVWRKYPNASVRLLVRRDS